MSADLRVSMKTSLSAADWRPSAQPVAQSLFPTPVRDRSEAWMRWMAGVRGKLLRSSGEGLFFANHWAAHSPAHFPVQPLPAMNWTPEALRRAAGEVEVEVQAGRLADRDYETRSHRHKSQMRFTQFLDLVESGPANDVYMTANNTAANAELLRALAGDLRPLPPILRPDPAQGFLWIGRDTLTPMHHDLTQNVMVQLVGSKVVRLVSPVEQRKLGNTLHVFADFHWLDDELAKRRAIAFTETLLTPGKALFIPVGWWHCVRAEGFSVTYTSTNFIWPNHWTEGFP